MQLVSFTLPSILACMSGDRLESKSCHGTNPRESLEERDVGGENTAATI